MDCKNFNQLWLGIIGVAATMQHQWVLWPCGEKKERE
jgi:hypothetical protein